MSRAGYRVLDVHHHVGDASNALPLPGPRVGAGDGNQELAIRLETMDRNGIDAAIVIPGHSYLRPAGLADTRRINDAIAAYRAAAADRFVAALGIVEPLYGPAGNDELRRITDELGFVGVSIHTRFQGVTTDSPLVLAQIAVMGELGLVPFIHSVAEATEEALWRAVNVARAFPDLAMVVLDAFSSHEQAAHALLAADVAPNLVFDTSLAYTVDPALAMMKRFGHQRVVFGTDLYSHPLGYTRSWVLEQLVDSGLPAQVLADVLHGTASRLLRLGSRPAEQG